MNLNFTTSRGKSKLNPFLVAQKKLTEGEVAEIIRLHVEKDHLLDRIEKSGDRGILREIEDVEYKLQEAWGFPRNRSYHRGWMEPKNCSCPRLDNLDSLGAGSDDSCFRYYNAECKLHGQILANQENK